jgi:hypothetical protein
MKSNIAAGFSPGQEDESFLRDLAWQVHGLLGMTHFV